MHDSWFRTCGDVIFQDVLNGYPLFTGNTPLMLSDSYNPFIHTCLLYTSSEGLWNIRMLHTAGGEAV